MRVSGIVVLAVVEVRVDVHVVQMSIDDVAWMIFLCSVHCKSRNLVRKLTQCSASWTIRLCMDANFRS